MPHSTIQEDPAAGGCSHCISGGNVSGFLVTRMALGGRGQGSRLSWAVVGILVCSVVVEAGMKPATPRFKPLIPPEETNFMKADMPDPAPEIGNIKLKANSPSFGFEAETPLVLFQDDFRDNESTSKKHDVMWAKDFHSSDVMELDSTHQFEEWEMTRRTTEPDLDIPFRLKFFDFEFVQRVPVEVRKASQYYERMFEQKTRPGGPISKIGELSFDKYEEARRRFEEEHDGEISLFKKFMLDYYQRGQAQLIRSSSPGALKLTWCNFLEKNGRLVFGQTLRNGMLDAMLDAHKGNGWATEELVQEILDLVTFKSEQLGPGWKPGYFISVPWLELSSKDFETACIDGQTLTRDDVKIPSASMQFTTSIPIEMVYDFFTDKRAVKMLSKSVMPASVVDNEQAEQYMRDWSRGDKSVALFISYMITQWLYKGVTIGGKPNMIGNPKNGIIFFMCRSNFVAVLNAVRKLREIEKNPNGLALDDKEKFLDDIAKVAGVKRDMLRDRRIGVGERPTDEALGTHEDEWLAGLVDPVRPHDKLKLYHGSMSQLGIQIRPKALEMVIEFRQPIRNIQPYMKWASWADDIAQVVNTMFGGKRAPKKRRKKRPLKLKGSIQGSGQ